MKKKLISIIMSLAMIFTIIPNSIVFANETPKDHPNSIDLINQDGLEGSIDLKSGSGFGTYNPTNNPYSDEIECAEYFEGMDKEEGDKARLFKDEYDGWQIMKIQIKISKKSGLEVKEIVPDDYKEVVPERIKEAYKEYFELQENDKEYIYNYYMKGNGTYNFTIKYSLDGADKETNVSYTTKENLLNIPDINMMTALYVGVGDPMAWSDDEDYVTEEFLRKEEFIFQSPNQGDLKKILPKIEYIEGIQYCDKLLSVDLAQGMSSSKLSDLNKDDVMFGGIEPLTVGYYENLQEFCISEKYGGIKPNIPEKSYTSGIIAECISKMPNLIELQCNGSGFKDFTVFKNSNGKLNLLGSRFNDIKSLKGIENCKDLGSIYLGRNSISSIEELSELHENVITLLDIQLNKIKDLRPVNKTLSRDVIPGIYFTAANQNIIEKDVVVSENAEDYIKIELPMPIDIDGSLTETQKVLATYNNVTKEYPISEENGKKYIEVKKVDFDGKLESELENIDFKFEFNNANGKDSRTKNWFNGTVTFNATFNPQVSNKYGVEYEFISGTPGKDLQGRLNDLLPEDLKLYKEGEIIKAIQPEKTVVKVRDGEWTFDVYDKEEKVASKKNADENINVKFVGIWNFHKKDDVVEKATVTYEAKNTSENNDDGDKDDNILDVENINVLKYIDLPVDKNEYNVGKTLTPENPKVYIKIDENGKEIGKNEYLKKGESTLAEYVEPNKKIKTYVRLTFEGYEPEELEVKAGEENKFIGKFKLEDMEEVNYQLKTDKGEDIPDKIKEEFKKIKEHEICSDGNVIKPDMPEHTEISDSNGTWIFKGWMHKDGKDYAYLPEEGVEVHHDDEFIGVWHFEPKNTGGGGGGTIVTPPTKPTDPDRIEGSDRIETSVETSKDLYPNGTNTVVLANAERYTDVLTADPFAIQEKASALLTYKYEIPEKTLKEIQRLGAKKIYISGGYEAVSKKVVDELAAKGYEIFRFDGVDRYDTARKIAIKIREKGNTNAAELASGEDFPDALCMTPLAVKDHAPILLTKKNSIPKYTKQALAEWDIENIKIGGLEKAVSPEVEKQLKAGFAIDENSKEDSKVYDGAKAIKRIGGEDRYETSAKLAKESYPESKLGVYATGEDFPDALIAGNYAGTKEAPVLLVKGDSLPEPIEKYTKESKIKKATIIGGVNAVSDKVFDLIKAAINK